MRDLRKKSAYAAASALVGAGILLANYTTDRQGETAYSIIFVASFTVTVLSFAVLVIFLLAAFGQARLMSGKGVIARWHVSPAEWDRFRAFDAARGAQHPSLCNELNLQKATPAGGVEVMVGRRQLIVDGSYHALSGIPALTGIYWHPAPVDPECIEFGLVYPGGQYGGAKRLSLRVPVPAHSREAGVRVYWHYHATLPKPGLGLLYRRPRLVLTWCVAVTLIAAAVGGAAALVAFNGNSSTFIAVLTVLGIGIAIGAMLVTAILLLLLWLRKSR
jgi:hypothetical protein